ncbi:hypothetical protein E5D57_004448 [Metarhizium anisopliae]|nr:hypothetical protein E5D57_004448 [Metarhizium anisopliae]
MYGSSISSVSGTVIGTDDPAEKYRNLASEYQISMPAETTTAYNLNISKSPTTMLDSQAAYARWGTTLSQMSQHFINVTGDDVQTLRDARKSVSKGAIFGWLRILQSRFGKSRLDVVDSAATYNRDARTCQAAIILFPICLTRRSNMHWVLVVLDPGHNTARIFDPMPSQANFETIRLSILDFCVKCLGASKNPEIHYSAPLLQMKNPDSGVLVLISAIYIAAGLPTPLGQVNVDASRHFKDNLAKITAEVAEYGRSPPVEVINQMLQRAPTCTVADPDNISNAESWEAIIRIHRMIVFLTHESNNNARARNLHNISTYLGKWLKNIDKCQWED